jgi:hypothetical protein
MHFTSLLSHEEQSKRRQDTPGHARAFTAKKVSLKDR